MLYHEPSSDVQDLQEQLVVCKLREAEANMSTKELEQKVNELDKCWQVGVFDRNYKFRGESEIHLGFGFETGRVSFWFLTKSVKLDEKIRLSFREILLIRCIKFMRIDYKNMQFLVWPSKFNFVLRILWSGINRQEGEKLRGWIVFIILC